MSDEVTNYTPPTTTTSNSDASGIAALVEQMVRERLAAAGLTKEPPKVLTPEEQARAALDAKGAGLGVDERLAELYRHLDLIAKKVGI